MKIWKALALTGVIGVVRRGSLVPSSAVLAAHEGRNVTLVWWNNANQGEGKALWAQVAKEFEASHPGVKIQDVPLQNEQLTTKIPLELQSSNPPDVFQDWGGGGLVDQVKAGKVANVTKYVSSWIKNIGGAAAGWQVNGQAVRDPVQPRRRRVLVQQGSLQAGRDLVPAEDVAPVHHRRREAEDGGHHTDRDRRQGSVAGCVLLGLLADEALQQERRCSFRRSLQLHDPCWLQAGQVLAAADRHDAVQRGFLATPAQQGATSSAGLVAQRQGSDGAARALEPRRDAAAHARPTRSRSSSGGSRSRTCPAARPFPARCSAAVTGSPVR